MCTENFMNIGRARGYFCEIFGRPDVFRTHKGSHKRRLSKRASNVLQKENLEVPISSNSSERRNQK